MPEQPTRPIKTGTGGAPLEPWPLLRSEIVQSFRIYDLRRDFRRSPRTGKEHTFLVLDTADWVNVVPVTPQGNVVMIRQFRHGTGAFVLEVPGGMVDPGDTSPEEAGRRELLEETGYAAERFRYIGAVHPNPAIQNNLCHTFLAESVRPRQAQRLEGTEDIEVIEIPYERIPDMIASGEITHSLVLMAFFWYELHLRGKRPPSAPEPALKNRPE
ncbi:MAG: NUDIX hydrolase [bacterium]